MSKLFYKETNTSECVFAASDFEQDGDRYYASKDFEGMNQPVGGSTQRE